MENKILESELNEVAGGNAYGAQYYLIVPGDTLSGIAQRFGTSVDQLMRLNPQIKDRNKIYAGQTIRVR